MPALPVRTTAPWTVTCARCGQDHAENSDEVTYRDGDWWCRFQDDCDDRITEATP